MDFCREPFEKRWNEIKRRAAEDQADEVLIPSRSGRGGNFVIGIEDDAIEIRSRRPTGKGTRTLKRRQFERIWLWLKGEVDKAPRAHQAPHDMIARYFDDTFYDSMDDGQFLFWWLGWEGDEEVIWDWTDDDDGDDDLVDATSPGSPEHEREVRGCKSMVGGVHEAIHRALVREMEAIGEAEDDGCEVERIRPVARLIPDLLLRFEAKLLFLFEIKSTGKFADVYEAIGQLQLYRSLYCQGEPTVQVLVIPSVPQEEIIREALESLGISLLLASQDEDGAWTIPGFDDWPDRCHPEISTHAWLSNCLRRQIILS